MIQSKRKWIVTGSSFYQSQTGDTCAQSPGPSAGCDKEVMRLGNLG